MIIKIKTLLTLLLVPFISSCAQHKTLLEQYDVNKPSFDLEKVDYFITTLETTEESIVATFDKVVVDEEIIAILDQRNMTVTIFDRTGKFVAKINRKGNSESEYVSLCDLELFDGVLHLLDDRKQKILMFDRKGEYIGCDVFPIYVGTSFSKPNKAEYLFYICTADPLTNNSEVIRTDRTGKIIETYYPRDEEMIFDSANAYFWRTDDGVYFIPVNSGELMKIDDKGRMSRVFDLNIQHLLSKNNPKDERMYHHYLFDLIVCNNGLFVCSGAENYEPFLIYGDSKKKKMRLANDQIFCGGYKQYLIIPIGNYEEFKAKGDELYPIEGDSNGALVFVNSESVLF